MYPNLVLHSYKYNILKTYTDFLIKRDSIMYRKSIN